MSRKGVFVDVKGNDFIFWERLVEEHTKQVVWIIRVLPLVVVDEFGLEGLLLNFGTLALRPNIQLCPISLLLFSFDSLHISQNLVENLES